MTVLNCLKVPHSTYIHILCTVHMIGMIELYNAIVLFVPLVNDTVYVIVMYILTLYT